MSGNGIELFVPDTKKKPPRMVSAGKLDRNFARCMPAQRGLLATTKVSHSNDGWFIDVPAPGSGTWVLGAVNGRMQWLPTQDC